jgi:CubicO group peptidase (beta-lactamase class C family)
MKRLTRILFFLFIVHPFSGYGQDTTDSTGTDPALAPDSIISLIPVDGFTQPTLKDSAELIRKIRGAPGLVYAVFTRDSIIDFQVLGYRVFKFKDPIQRNDLFNIGTNTAAFTAYIAAKLVEAKKIKWNTQLLKVFPEFSKKTFPVYKSITLQDLLTSRTRLPPFMEMSEWFKIPNYPGDIISRRKSFTYWMLQHKPNSENFLSDKIVFSLAGYVVAASMMEKITGKSWEDLLTEYIRKPLKISIRYSWPNIYSRSEPYGHWEQGGSFHAEEPETWVKGNPVLYPGQAVSISMPDYIKYMQMNMDGLAGDITQLPAKYFEFLYFGVPDYSMGWNNGSFNDQAFAFHEGYSLLFNCRTEILREKNIGIIVMCNAGDKDGRGAVLDITRLLEAKYF